MEFSFRYVFHDGLSQNRGISRKSHDPHGYGAGSVIDFFCASVRQEISSGKPLANGWN